MVETGPRRHTQNARHKRTAPRNGELIVAITVIAAAALATFLALFLTSRPFDPMNASLGPQQVVPAGPLLSPSPKSTPSTTPTPLTQVSPSTPGGEVVNEAPDDATIQSRIESAIAADPSLSKLDVSTLVENGKVTIVGSVKSTDVKQRVERVIRGIRGVANVDNQLVITEATPS